MILGDFHTHTTFCDGKNAPEEMVRAAIDLKMKRLGFSVHSYVDFDADYCIDPSRIDEYKATIRALAQKYKNKIEILCGIEQDYYSTTPTDGFDYVIASVHYVKKDGVYYAVDNSPKIFEALGEKYNGNYINVAKDYFKVAGDLLNRIDGDIIGHFDLITKFNQDDKYFDTRSPEYLAAAKEAVDRLITKKKPFEINTGAISRGYRKEAYPSLDLIEYIYQKGGRVIFSSDSHSKDTLCYEFDKYEDLARRIGFKDFDLCIKTKIKES